VLAEHGRYRLLSLLYLAFILAGGVGLQNPPDAAPMRRLIIWLFLGFAVALLSSSSPLRDEPDFSVRPITLTLTPVSREGIVAIEQLAVVGTWAVTSSDRGFGGVSAMAIDRGRMILITDTGSVIDAAPRFGSRRAVGVIAGTAAGCGYDGQKTSRDSESLAVDPVTGVRWIGFEWRNVICRIDPRQPESTRFVAPAAMRRWPNTGGAEAMARLSDGRFIVIAERARDKGRNSPIVVFSGDPADPTTGAVTASYIPPEGSRPTEVAELPDGSLLVLTRSFRPPFSFEGQLAVVPREAIGAESVEGKIIARFTAPLDDNFEALAVTHAEDRTYIWAMTDDNFMPFQRTILVLLEVRG
jgi:hypothetical protein